MLEAADWTGFPSSWKALIKRAVPFESSATIPGENLERILLLTAAARFPAGTPEVESKFKDAFLFF